MFVTEAQLRYKVRSAFEREVHVEDDLERRAKEEGKPFRRRTPANIFDGVAYKTWENARVEDYRSQGYIVSEQQLADIQSKRVLRAGDVARYIGPDRLEQTQSGRFYNRPTGQVGLITRADKRSDGLHIYVFTPNIPPEAFDPATPKHFVATFEFREWTRAYFTIERCP